MSKKKNKRPIGPKPQFPDFKVASPEETAKHRISPEQAKAWEPGRKQVRQWEQHEAQQSRMREASTAPFPGPLRAAFAEFPRTLLGFKLIPLCAGHVAALTQINSPFLQGMRMASMHATADSKAEKKRIEKLASQIKIAIEDVGIAFFIFTKTYQELLGYLDEGEELFRARARDFWAQLPPVTEWPEIQVTLGAHYFASYATALKFEAKERPGERSLNFRVPGPKSMTASAQS